MTRAKIGMTGLLLCIGLAGCEQEVILEGERFPVRAPLEDSIPVEGQAAPTAAAAVENRAVPISVPAQSTFAEWSHRGGSASHTGGNGTLSAAPERIWSVKIGAGSSKRERITAAPVVSGGRVFAMDAASNVAAVTVGGALLWTASVTPESDRGGQVPGGGLAVQGTQVYATTGYGELIALETATGRILWRQHFDAPVTGAPTVSGNTVYAIGADGSAMAVSTANGRLLWQIAGTPSNKGVITGASPVASGSEILFPFASGEIAAVSADGGERTWGAAVAGKRLGRAYAALGDVTGDPVVVGGVVYAGTAGGRTVAIDAKTGMRLWVANEGAMNPPLVFGGAVFVVSDEARLIRLDASTGEVVWTADMPYYVNDKPKKLKAIFANYGPVLAGGRLVVASSDGQLRSFDPTNGAMTAITPIPGGAAAAPALAQGMLFVQGANGQLHAFR